MTQWLSIVGGAGGLLTVIGGVVMALLNRKRTGAETAEMANRAAQIGVQMVDERMAHLRIELWDAMGLSDERRRVMGKMDRAISVMRLRIERHGEWDHKVKAAIEELRRVLAEHGIETHVTVEEPPSLDFSDIDFDFTIRPPKHNDETG